MVGAGLTKARLLQLRRDLAASKAALPALELKRRQILAWRGEARALCERLRAELERLGGLAGAQLPMLAQSGVQLEGLLAIRRVHLAREGRLGLDLPLFAGVEFEVRPYGRLTHPHWVDRALALAKVAIETRLRLRTAEQRREALEFAARKATQRVNVFEKVRIPALEAEIGRIVTHLADAQRSAVVIGKLAKAKRLREAAP